MRTTFEDFEDIAGERNTVTRSSNGSSGSSFSLNAEWPKKTQKVDLFPVPMKNEAFRGITGEIVNILEPHFEGSRESLLGQFLVAFGNILGRSATRYQAGSHHLNEFFCLVGATSAGRKGTSWSMIRELLRHVDSDWQSRIVVGIQSGEAIVHNVRDDRATNDGKLLAGVQDKRLLILEEELARIIAASETSGGRSISPMLRNVWDSPQVLRNAGKHSPDVATGAHVSMIAHVTKEELLKVLSTTEFENGFCNRILWCATRTNKRIALPGWIDWMEYRSIIDKLHDVSERFRADTVFDLSSPCATQWVDWYNHYNNGTGMLAKITARAEAHVLRLAMIYAALDNTSIISADHLNAAIAFWNYCRDSVRWIFSDTTGNRRADRILAALKRHPEGLTRTDISDNVFNRNSSREEIDQAVETLLEASLIVERSAPSDVPGKLVRRFFLKNG